MVRIVPETETEKLNLILLQADNVLSVATTIYARGNITVDDAIEQAVRLIHGMEIWTNKKMVAAGLDPVPEEIML